MVRIISSCLKQWREAATVMLIAKKPPKVPSTALADASDNPMKRFDYKILMLERSNKSKFMPSAFVFPGGATGKADFTEKWLQIYKDGGFCTTTEGPFSSKVDQDIATRSPMFIDPIEKGLSAEISFRICAIRETFEETGILLYQPWKSNGLKLNKELLKEWRRTVYRNEIKFLDMFSELKVVPDIWSLHEWSNWLTPTNMDAMHGGRRFDTAFYICPMKKSIDSVHDEQEIVSSEWCDPSDLVERYKEGELWLAPPQIYEMARLANFKQIEDLEKYIDKRSSKGCERWLPVRITCKDIMLSVLPGDDLYPSEPDVEGTLPAPVLDLSAQESLETTQKQHRFEFYGPHDCRLHCNVPASFDLVAPKLGDSS